MNAKDLMIGDWVMNDSGFSAKEPIRICPEMFVIAKADGAYARDIIDVEPIPLTPEILEKNGFECRGAWLLPGEDLGMRQDGESWGLLPYYAEYDALAFCHIKYVHELQHALKLCEIEKEIVL